MAWEIFLGNHQQGIEGHTEPADIEEDWFDEIGASGWTVIRIRHDDLFQLAIKNGSVWFQWKEA